MRICNFFHHFEITVSHYNYGHDHKTGKRTIEGTLQLYNIYNRSIMIFSNIDHNQSIERTDTNYIIVFHFKDKTFFHSIFYNPRIYILITNSIIIFIIYEFIL